MFVHRGPQMFLLLSKDATEKKDFHFLRMWWMKQETGDEQIGARAVLLIGWRVVTTRMLSEGPWLRARSRFSRGLMETGTGCPDPSVRVLRPPSLHLCVWTNERGQEPEARRCAAQKHSADQRTSSRTYRDSSTESRTSLFREGFYFPFPRCAGGRRGDTAEDKKGHPGTLVPPHSSLHAGAVRQERTRIKTEFHNKAINGSEPAEDFPLGKKKTPPDKRWEDWPTLICAELITGAGGGKPEGIECEKWEV